MGKSYKRKLLREKRMVLHGHCEARATLVEDISKVDQGRSEGHCIHCKNSQNAELYWEYLIGSYNLYWYPHCEFFVFIFGRSLIILLN